MYHTCTQICTRHVPYIYPDMYTICIIYVPRYVPDMYHIYTQIGTQYVSYMYLQICTGYVPYIYPDMYTICIIYVPRYVYNMYYIFHYNMLNHIRKQKTQKTCYRVGNEAHQSVSSCGFFEAICSNIGFFMWKIAFFMM